VHPSQSPEEGWVDITTMLQSVGTITHQIAVIFENMPTYPKELGDHDYREGVKWVKELLEISS
ncbi:MAG: hypothetical protein JSV02_04315, partial [Dehalococcoidia bacterium]